MKTFFTTIPPSAFSFILLFGMLITLHTSCIETQSSKAINSSIDTTQQTNEPESVISLFGTTLPDQQFSNAQRTEWEMFLKKVEAEYQSDPTTLDNIYWYGRALAYSGSYSKAVKVYSKGLTLYPDSYRLLGNRGKELIVLRKFDKAIEDLQQAAFYIRTAENEPEPDVIPTTDYDFQPVANVKFNTWFHLGIAYYLKGNYDKAISSFKKSQLYTDNDDLIVLNTDWFYMTYRKLGNLNAASSMLEKINTKMSLTRNHESLKRLLLFKGKISKDKVLRDALEADTALSPVLGYGIGNWYLFNGKPDSARMVYQQILEHPQWNSFSYIAAESDLHSLAVL